MKKLLTAVPFAFLLACSATSSGPSTAGSAAPASTGADVDAGASTDDAGPVDPCSPAPRKSACGVDSSWVRGIAHFDPSHFKPGAKPALRMALRHSFTLFAGEEKVGGRLHSYASVTNVDTTKGEIQFAIDQCGLGAAMWSEENGTFHLALSLDENDNNDLDNAQSNNDAIAMSQPDATELQKLIDVDVSCHAPSACLDVNLDCTGTTCFDIKPITNCTKKTPACKSVDAYCK